MKTIQYVQNMSNNYIAHFENEWYVFVYIYIYIYIYIHTLNRFLNGCIDIENILFGKKTTNTVAR